MRFVKTFTPLLFVLVAFVVFVVYWQYGLVKTPVVSCGGDWSYSTQCSFGTYCKSLGQGELAGGVCRPYLLGFIGFSMSDDGVDTQDEGMDESSAGSVVGPAKRFTTPTVKKINEIVDGPNEDLNTYKGRLSLTFDDRRCAIDFPSTWNISEIGVVSQIYFYDESQVFTEVNLSFPAREIPSGYEKTRTAYAGYAVAEYRWKDSVGKLDSLLVVYLDEEGNGLHSVWFKVPKTKVDYYLQQYKQVLDSFRVL